MTTCAQNFPRSATVALALGIVVAIQLPCHAADVTPPSTDEHVVQLPPFLVEDTTAALRWRYLAVGNIELLSLCDDAETIRFVERVHRIEELFHTLVPARFCFQSDIPEIYLVVNEDVGRFRSREIIEQLVQKEGATVGSDGTVRLPMIAGPAFGPLVRAQERRVTFFPNLHLWDADGSVLLTILHPSSAENFTLSVEGVTYALERRLPALPEWFTVGMTALFERAKIGEDDISILPAVWISASESTALGRDPNFPRTLLPVEQLFFPDRPTDPTTAREFDEIWHAESALFVRWALLDQNGARREALWRFVDRLEREPISESLFQQEFGCGFADAFDRLSEYLGTAVTQRVTVDGPKTIPLPHLKLRDAAPLEVARLRGEWERLEIPFVRQRLPSLVTPYVSQARRTLHRAYDRGVRDPRLSALLGLTECDAGDTKAGMPYLEDAMRGRVVRPHVYLEIARARYAAIRNGTTDQKLTEEQIGRINEPLQIACKQAPPLRDVYLLMAEAWSHAGKPPPPDQLAMLNAGVRLFPQIAPFVGRVIQLNLAAGRVTDAIDDAEAGARAARTRDVRDGFERLIAGLQRLVKDQQAKASADH